MMPIRNAARSAPRMISRFGSRQFSLAARPGPVSVRSSTWTAVTRLSSPKQQSPFSTTTLRSAPSAEVDGELSAKLESELQFEGEMKENEQLPASVKDFLENSPFELKDTPGKEDVILTRKFNDETVTVSFSISDLANYEPDMYNDEQALPEEGLEEGERGEEGEEGGENEGPVPCRLNVVIEKPNKGALNIEAVAQDGQVMVENFYYFNDPKLAHGESAETTHAAQDVYPGPPFGSLDEDLQLLMERYLEERGVTQALAVFVPDYMDIKEQREYQAWLKDVKGFIDA